MVSPCGLKFHLHENYLAWELFFPMNLLPLTYLWQKKKSLLQSFTIFIGFNFILLHYKIEVSLRYMYGEDFLPA